MGHSRIISGKTEIYALFGDPVSHSLSPIIYNSAFEHEKMDKVYIVFKAGKKDLSLAIDMARTFSIKGFNLTMPLKEEILQYLDKISPEAELIGAVNCVKNEDGILTGYNTDSIGFGMSLLSTRGKYPSCAFVFGAGGAAKAVTAHLAMNKVGKIYITNRNYERARTLTEKLSSYDKIEVEILPWESRMWCGALNESDLIVNCTSLGMNNKGNLAELIPWECVGKDTMIYETIYEPLNTAFIMKADSLNLDNVKGTNLLIHQAAVAFKIWTDREAPLDVIKKSVADFLNLHQK